MNVKPITGVKPMFKLAGPTKGFAARPSAAAHANIGDFRPKVYGGWLHVMEWNVNGVPSYRAIAPCSS